MAYSKQGQQSDVEGVIDMPQSVDAERSVLGAVLLDNMAYNEIASGIQADDFFLDSHRRIYSRMIDLGESGRPINFITLCDELGKKKEIEAVGGIAYISSLTDGVPRRDSIIHYITMIRDKSVLRKIIHMSTAAIASASSDTGPESVIEEIQHHLIQMIFHGKQGGVDWKEAGREWFKSMNEIRASERRCIGVPTGLAELDELTTGYRKNEFYVIGARPGNGKTAFMCQSIVEAVKSGYKPGCFSVEVDREQIITRLACQIARLNVFDARDPRTLNVTDFNELTNAAAEITQTWDVFLEDGRLNPKRLAAIARYWIAKGCDIIFVDYLQKLAARAPGKTEYDRVTYTADALWDLARFAGVPVVALSQLKRSGEKRPPSMEDLRSSGEIEQNAHAVMLIWCPEDEDEDGITAWTYEDQLILAKQRSGPANVHIKVKFNRPVGLFEPRGQ